MGSRAIQRKRVQRRKNISKINKISGDAPLAKVGKFPKDDWGDLLGLQFCAVDFDKFLDGSNVANEGSKGTLFTLLGTNTRSVYVS